MYIVSAYMDGVGWKDVSVPTDRDEAAMLVYSHWKLGRKARRRLAPTKKPGSKSA